MAQQSGGRVRAFGYLPRFLPRGVQEDLNPDRFARRFNSSGSDFSPLEPLQGWTDMLAAGVDPRRVKLLSYAGGRISRIECILAARTGARVGVVEDATLPNNRQFNEPEWQECPNLVQLPMDPMTLRAFLLVDELPCRRDEFAAAAQKTHEEYVKSAIPKESSLLPWGDLPEVLKVSNFHQVAYAENILKTAGLGVRRITDPGEPLVSMTDLLDEAGLERLAEMEHGRWNVERLLLGLALGRGQGRRPETFSLSRALGQAPAGNPGVRPGRRPQPAAEVPRGRARGVPSSGDRRQLRASGVNIGRDHLGNRTYEIRLQPVVCGDCRDPPCANIDSGRRAGRRGRERRGADRCRHPARRDLRRAGDGGTGRPARLRSGPGDVEHAKELLKQASLPPDEAERIGNRITAVEGDLEDQIARARGTLEGVFPLTRFLTSPLFADSGPTAVYRLIDDPAVKATERRRRGPRRSRSRTGKEVRAVAGGIHRRSPDKGRGEPGAAIQPGRSGPLPGPRRAARGAASVPRIAAVSVATGRRGRDGARRRGKGDAAAGPR